VGRLTEALKKDAFAAASGVEVVEARRGHAVTRMKVETRHLNCLDLLHGGAIFTLAATAFFAAASSAGRAAVGLNLTITFLQAVRAGTLRATATELGRSRKTVTCSVRITDEDDHLIATFQGTAFITEDPFPPPPA
jgi:acyl-CoA thioesterase